MSEHLLSQNTRAKIDEFKQAFAAARPFKFVVIDNFFQPEFCQQLLDEFPTFKDDDAIDENKTVGKKAVVQSVSSMGGAYKTLDSLVQSKSFLEIVEQITGIAGLIYDPHYIGGGTHNNLDTQELDPHVDFTHHPLTNHHRRLNLIVYLNHEWEPEWGGNIEFHQNPRRPVEQDQITRILPLFNRAVIFETNNHSWHGFQAIQLPANKKHLSRKSFALYYYTNKRQSPIEPHSTIYVERHLADKFKTGLQLSDEDVHELKAQISRRDQHLARLYQTITTQTKTISQLKTEVSTLKIIKGDPANRDKNLSRHLELMGFDEMRLLNRVQELENSKSWRMTAPIRKFKRWLGW